jgi:type IV secretory pathway VirB10-like protein
VLAVAVLCVTLGACGQGPAPSGAAAAPDQASREAQLAERERAIAEREAAVAAKEQKEQAARDQAAAAAEAEALAKAEAETRAKADAEAAAVAQAEKDKAAAEQRRLAAERAAADKKAARDSAARAETQRRSEEAKAKAAAAARPIEVPAGTRLAVALKQSLSSKTSHPGERFEAVLTSDVTGTDGRVAVPAGATVAGTITHVVSGSRSIGATPVIGLRFDHIVTAGGHRIPISGELDERGASERGRDTAKILGGVAAGAVIGNQSRNNDRGRLIGGLLGGAIGAIAAKNSGTEVSLGDGAALTIALDTAFTVNPAGKPSGG